MLTTKSTRNFEMDRAVRHEKNALGTIDRLSVAVVVNERMAPLPADGKPLPAGALAIAAPPRPAPLGDRRCQPGPCVLLASQ